MLLLHWRRQSAPTTQGPRDSLQRVRGISSTLPTLDSRPQEGAILAREAHLLPFLAVEKEADSIVEDAKKEAV